MGIYNRHSPRLSGYDYAQAGAYFVTVCTQDRQCLFGDVSDGQMRMNGFGQIVEEEWLLMARLRPTVQLDAFVVMPNHLHGIIFIGDLVGTRRAASLQPPPYRLETFSSPIPGSLSNMMRTFKAAVTKRLNLLRDAPGVMLWQARFHEYMIRDENSLNAIREYILANPERWDTDEENPVNMSR